MNSGKTIEILKVAHNYEEQGKPVVIMTSALDTRDGFGVVSSRIGMRREAVPISSDMDVFTFIDQLEEKPYCVLIDESQFLSKQNVYDLARVVDKLNVPVMAFGLKNDFQNELFEDQNTFCFWPIRLTKSKQSVNIAARKPRWFYGLKMKNRCMRVLRYKSEGMKPIFQFAVSITFTHPLAPNSQ